MNLVLIDQDDFFYVMLNPKSQMSKNRACNTRSVFLVFGKSPQQFSSSKRDLLYALNREITILFLSAFSTIPKLQTINRQERAVQEPIQRFLGRC